MEINFPDRRILNEIYPVAVERDIKRQIVHGQIEHRTLAIDCRGDGDADERRVRKNQKQLINARVPALRRNQKPEQPCHNNHQHKAHEINAEQNQKLPVAHRMRVADRGIDHQTRHRDFVDQKREHVIALHGHDPCFSRKKADAHHHQQHQHFLKYNSNVNHFSASVFFSILHQAQAPL